MSEQDRESDTAETIDKTMDEALPDQLEDERLGAEKTAEPGLDAVWGDEDEAED